MWVRLGVNDGMRYLAKHFQIVVFNRDVSMEDFGRGFSQVNLIHQYFAQNDVHIDAIYSAQQGMTPASENSKESKKSVRKEAKKNPDEIWEDYKQIYLDFSLNNDLKVRDRVLFVNSIDLDYNPRIEDIRFDSQGYFLIDTLSQPAKPLTSGLPLTYETGEEIDLSDKKGTFNFNNRKEVVSKEMPVTILIPNPRIMYG
jgi:hypothetical protein